MSARLAPMLRLALLAPILSGCATTGTGGTDRGVISPAAVARICASWPPVGWSSRDTPETIVDAKASNAARKGFCAKAG